MHAVASNGESQPSLDEPSIAASLDSESRVDQRQQIKSEPSPTLNALSPPQGQESSKEDLRLLDHLSAIAQELSEKGASSMTTWTQKLPK